MSYVGALCIQSGYDVVQDWINQLLEKRIKSEHPPPTLPPFFGSQGHNV